MQKTLENKIVSQNETLAWIENSLGMDISDLMPKNLVSASKIITSANKKP